MTIDGVGTFKRIYWALKQLVIALYKSLSHRLMFSVTVFTALLGNAFRLQTFSFFRFPELSPAAVTWCGSSFYTCIASVRTAQKTPLPTDFQWLRACLLGLTRDGYWDTAWQRTCSKSRFLGTAVSADFTILDFNRHATLYIYICTVQCGGQEGTLWHTCLYIP
jgi:hypothetical protein